MTGSCYSAFWNEIPTAECGRRALRPWRISRRAMRAVRERLVQVLRGTESTELRAGAARGLGRAAIRSPSISDTLLQIESMQDVPAELQLACTWALVDQLGQNTKVTDEIKSWLDLNRNTRASANRGPGHGRGHGRRDAAVGSSRNRTHRARADELWTSPVPMHLQVSRH